MSWLGFGSSKSSEQPAVEANPYASLAPAPPASTPLVPAPEPPKGYKPSASAGKPPVGAPLSAPPPTTFAYKPAPSTEDAYEKEIASSSFSNVPDVSGLKDSMNRALSGDWIQNPRARQCVNNIQLGMKMGGLVGGIFGALAGTVYAVRERRFLVLPATMIVSAASFGFFLGCGMIIRCDGNSSCVPVLDASPKTSRFL